MGVAESGQRQKQRRLSRRRLRLVDRLPHAIVQRAGAFSLGAENVEAVGWCTWLAIILSVAGLEPPSSAIGMTMDTFAPVAGEEIDLTKQTIERMKWRLGSRSGVIVLGCLLVICFSVVEIGLIVNVRAESAPAQVVSIATATAMHSTATLPARLAYWAWPTSTPPTPTPTKPAPTLPPASSLRPSTTPRAQWQWPLRNAQLTQGFSAEHSGWDMAGPIGSAVFAAANGKVEFAGWNSDGYGYMVVVNHGNGVETWYAHLQYIIVSPGQWVRAGDQIGTMGGSGNVAGWHLHFEVRVNGQLVDPGRYLP